MIELTQANLRRLGVPAAIAVALVGLGLAGLAVTDTFADRAKREYEAARIERAGVQSRLSRATDDEREIRARLVDYQTLRTRGVLGDEHRLDWVEAIKVIKSERKLYDMKYSIEPRRPVDYAGLKQVAGVDLLMSRMRLDIELLHEADLFNLLADMKERLAPIVVVRSCDLNRVDGRGLAGGAGPRLRANCTLDLVTIRDGKEKP